MPINPMFVNLHTHRKPQLSDELVVRNAFIPSGERLRQINYPVSCGIHPWLIAPNWKHQLLQLEALLHKEVSILAIGECGFDRLKGPDISTQLEVFEGHVHLANTFQKPLILHLVKATSDLLALTSKIKVPFIVHGFKGSPQEAEQLLRKGARLSFGPRLLTENALQEIFATLPANQLYLETDVRPVKIDQIYQHAAQIRNLSLTDLRNLIWNNFTHDFNYNQHG